MQVKSFLLFVTFISFLGDQLCADEVRVGVILDMGSWEGKTVHSCVSMGISDFYTEHRHFYNTRIVLHVKDSQGELLHALSSAFDLLENNRVDAMIGAPTFMEAKFLLELAYEAKIPIISFSLCASSPTSANQPYLLQVTQDEASQAKSIAAIAEAFNWRDVILIYEDTDRNVVKYFADSFQEKNILITYQSALVDSSNDDQIIGELYKYMALHTRVFIVHVSRSLGSRLFSNAIRLGMMNEECTWMLTLKSMCFLDSKDSSVVKSMQGVIGLRPHFAASDQKLQNFTSRRRRKFPNLEVMELNELCVFAYDVAWSLAKAAERTRMKTSPPTKQDARLNVEDSKASADTRSSLLYKEMLQSRINGLSGEFQFIDGRAVPNAYEIVSVTGAGEKRVGFWTTSGELASEIQPPGNGRLLSSSTNDLEAPIMPAGSATIPRGFVTRNLMSGKRLRIGVPLKGGFQEFVKVDRDIQTNTATVTGFCIDVFKAAIESLPYKVHYEFVPFMDAAGQHAGTYNDLVYQVFLGNYDAVVGDTTIMAERLSFVDFTVPYTDLGLGMLVRKDNKNMWIFLKPLSGDLSLTTATFLVLTGLVVWIIERPINNEFQGSPSQQVRTIFCFSLSTIVSAQRERLLSNLSRFVVIVWMFVVLILTSSYIATLTSMLTVQQIHLASNVDFIGYQMGAMQGVINNSNFKDYRLKPYNSAEDYAAALSEGTKDGGVSAIIDEIPYIKAFLGKYPDDYCMIPQKVTTNGFGFVFPKGSPMVHDMSRAIARLRQDGKLVMIENAWFHSRSLALLTPNDTANNLSTLHLDSFGGLFLISGISLAVAVLIYCVRVLCAYWHVVRNLNLGELVVRLLGSVKNNGKYLMNPIIRC